MTPKERDAVRQIQDRASSLFAGLRSLVALARTIDPDTESRRLPKPQWRYDEQIIADLAEDLAVEADRLVCALDPVDIQQRAAAEVAS